MKSSNESFKRNTFKQNYFEDENLVGKFQFPLILAEKQELCNFLPFNLYMSAKDKNIGVHFFIDDYQFERIWTNPTQYIKLLKQAKVVLSPDKV